MLNKQAKFVHDVTVIDPDTKGQVELSVFKHPNGGMFAIDSSYIDQNFEDGEYVFINNPLDDKPAIIELIGV